MSDFVCDSLQDSHALATNRCQIVFCRIYLGANGISCPLLLTFFLIVSFKMPNTVELSVRSGVAGCMWTNSVSVTLSGAPLWAFWKHAPHSKSAADATTLLMTDTTLRIEPFSVSSCGVLSPQKINEGGKGN
jgi:hypothetical protein